MTIEEGRTGLQSLRSLLPLLRPYRGTLIAGLACLTLAATLGLALPWAIGRLIDASVARASVQVVDQWFALVLAGAVVMAAFASLRYYLVGWLGERVVADLRERVFARLMALELAFFEDQRSGELLSRLNADTTLVQASAGVNLSLTLRSALMAIGGLVLMVASAPGLAGTLVLLMATVVVPLVVFGRRVRRLSRATQDRVAEASGLAGEFLGAIENVQAMGLGKPLRARFADAVERSFEAGRRRLRARAALIAIALGLIMLSVTCVLWLGTRATLAGDMTPGTLGQFLLYAMIVAASTSALSEMWGELQRAAGALDRVATLLATEPRIVGPPEPVPLPTPPRGAIRFEGVHFAYPSAPERAALRGFDLEIAPGETVALVGPSGAGKSTVLRLLLRLFDVGAGRITLDGINIRELALADLRSTFAVVPQDPLVFSGSVRDNIAIAASEADDDAVVRAARAADASDFIAALSDGFDTPLGERGVRLSGGQRQRVALARAFARNAPVLLLDEATSALDSDTEARVREATEHFGRARTCLVIAHRLATVTHADRIVVVEDGRVSANGRHGELLATSASYARWVRLQSTAPEGVKRPPLLESA